MQALISELVQKANLSKEQAQKAAEVVRGFARSHAPEALKGPIDSALTGERVQGAAEAAQSKLGGMLK